MFSDPPPFPKFMELFLFRVVYGTPLSHLIVILVYMSNLFILLAVMSNLLCYVFLKFAYFMSFHSINNIYDETILKMLRITALSTSTLRIAYEIALKVVS